MAKQTRGLAPGTDLCEAPHFHYHLQGTLHIVMGDGTEFEARPGDVTALPQGHDAWVVGDEPVVVVDWWGAGDSTGRVSAPAPAHLMAPSPGASNYAKG